MPGLVIHGYSAEEKSHITQDLINEVYPYLFFKYLTSEEISKKLHMTPRRLECIQLKIYELMGVKNHSQFVYWAREGCPQLTKK